MADYNNRNSGHSWAPGFFAPPSQLHDAALSQCSVATQPPPPRKSKNHRKRHVPPGPAGVWYQAKQHAAALSTENEDGGLVPTHTPTTREPLPAPDVTVCPAWMLMQLQLPLLTPYLPPYATIPQRYAALRQVLPSDYALLPDIQDSLVIHKKLLVLVHAVQSHSSCDWTVELHDETGTTVQAWIAPSLVQKESEQPEKVRPGVVWCLQGVPVLPTTAADNSQTSGSSTTTNAATNTTHAESKWLLVSQDTITHYWVAPKEVPHHVYLQWMEKRHALPNPFQVTPVNRRNVSETANHDVEEEEEMEVEVELPIRTVPRPFIPLPQHHPHGIDQDEDQTLPADFGLQVLPSLHLPTPSASSRPTPTDDTQTTVIPSPCSIPTTSATTTPSRQQKRQQQQPQPWNNQNQRRTNTIQESSSSSNSIQEFIPISMRQHMTATETNSRDTLRDNNTPSTPIPQPSRVMVPPSQQHDTTNPQHSSSQQPNDYQHNHDASHPPLSVEEEELVVVEYSTEPIGPSPKKQATTLSASPSSSSLRAIGAGEYESVDSSTAVHPSSNHKRTKRTNSKNHLAQFAATTATTKTIVNNNNSKENLSPRQSRMERNASLPQSKNASKGKVQSSALSKLFAGPSAMMDMFDDDDGDDDNGIPSSVQSAQTTSRSVHATAHEPGRSLFQNSNIVGLIDMFDDDDENDD